MNEEPLTDAQNKTAKLERRLSALKLAKHSPDYLEKGVDHIRLQLQETKPRQFPFSFWSARLPAALTTALVLSVSANVFQLAWNKQRIDALESEQLVQCDLPVARSSSTDDFKSSAGFQFEMPDQAIQTLGTC